MPISPERLETMSSEEMKLLVRELYEHNERKTEEIDRLNTRLKALEDELANLKKDYHELRDRCELAINTGLGKKLPEGWSPGEMNVLGNEAAKWRGKAREVEDRLLKHEAKWDVIRLSDGRRKCSWVNSVTGQLEQQEIPVGFNPHIVEDMSFDSTKENCTITWGGGQRLVIANSLYETLKATIPAPQPKKIDFRDLEAILRKKRYSGPVRVEMKKTWAQLLAGNETVPQIAQASGVSKESVYKYRDIWLDRNIILVNGEQVVPNPDIFELTETGD